MRFAVFADLLRPLTSDEKAALFAAVDKLIPNSGCVGPNRSGDFEVYFTVDAPTQETVVSIEGSVKELPNLSRPPVGVAARSLMASAS